MTPAELAARWVEFAVAHDLANRNRDVPSLERLVATRDALVKAANLAVLDAMSKVKP